MFASRLLESPAVWLSAALAIAYTIYSLIWRLYWSPLAKFPGPKLAAATLWYEFYYDVILKGQYTFKLKELHKKYGPIIRISPGELHIDDRNYYEELFVGPSVRKSDRYEWTSKSFAAPSAIFGTVDHDLHRMRRAPLNGFFSRAAVTKLEPFIQPYVDKMLKKLKEYKGTGRPVIIGDAVACLTSDIITDYCFARPVNQLDSEDFEESWRKPMTAITQWSHLAKQYHWILPVMMAVPLNVLKRLDPRTGSFLQMRFDFEDQVREILEKGKGEKMSEEHATVFHSVIYDSELPKHELTPYRVGAQEAQNLVSAGTFTTAHTLWVIVFHLLDQPALLEKLRNELSAVMKDNPKPTWQELEQLPYLTAVIKEGMRWGMGLMTRTQRVFREDIKYKDWIIPAGAAVGMTQSFLLWDMEVFPEPNKFDPDRWNVPKEKRPDKYLIVFGKGSRSCIGMNLAWCEIYLTVAHLFGPQGVDMKLFETDYSDVEAIHDFVVACPKLDSKGVRVTIE